VRREERRLSISDVLAKLLERLSKLEKEREDLVAEIYEIGEDAEKEAEDLGQELSTLKEQTEELTEVLTAIRAHRRRASHPQID